MARKETNFKQTDIGLIPHDWEVISLGQIGDVKMCKRIFKSQTKETGEIPFYKIGTFGQTPDAFISRSIFERYKANYSYPSLGAILLSASGTIGRRVKYKGEDAYYQDSNIVWLSHNEDKVLNDYLYYAYSRVNWTTEKGAAISRLYNKLFLSAKIPQPPIEEQRRIAEVLSHFDEHIDNLVALLEKRKQVKTATMHALLSGTTRLPGFTQPWKEKLLSELFLVLKGNGLSKSVVGNKGKYPCILYGQLFTTYKENIQSVVSYTDLDEGVSSNEGDVLMPASTTTSGEDLAIASALQVEGVRLGGDIIIFRPKQLLSSLFMAYIIRGLKKKITSLSQGITIVHISGKRVLDLEVTIPSTVKEQEAIASILSNMDRGIEVLEQRIEKYRQMKEGAMEKLLTGKTRLL